MTPVVVPGSTDLLVPQPGPEETWDPHTIHTHYFGFSIPEASIGAHLYIRYMPTYPLIQGGVVVFRGLDNRDQIDAAHMDYQRTMPWPQWSHNTVTTANGLSIEFVRPGECVRLRYGTPEDRCHFDVTQTAVSPLLGRGHAMPGEETATDPAQSPGGSEQFMRATGSLMLDGTTYAIDCLAPRDRTWRQVRRETRGGPPGPPIAWTPVSFGEDLSFNQIGVEDPAGHPAWGSAVPFPAGAPTHHYGWIYRNGDIRGLRTVSRAVLERDPHTLAGLLHELRVVDDTGEEYHFHGRAIALNPVPAWPNLAFRDSVVRWEDADGRVTHSTVQEAWSDDLHRVLRDAVRSRR